MIKKGDKVICTRLDYIDANGNSAELSLTIGKIYEVHMSVSRLAIYVNGWSFASEDKDDVYLRYYKDYFITYSEWLALEREKQIKTVLDD